MVRRFVAATLGDPEMHLVAVEMVITAVDDGRRGAVFKGQQRGAIAFSRPLHIEATGDGPHGNDVQARDGLDAVDLMRKLVIDDAAALAGIKLFGRRGRYRKSV